MVVKKITVGQTSISSLSYIYIQYLISDFICLSKINIWPRKQLLSDIKVWIFLVIKNVISNFKINKAYWFHEKPRLLV